MLIVEGESLPLTASRSLAVPLQAGTPRNAPLSVNPSLRICAFSYLRSRARAFAGPIALIVALPLWGGRRFPLGPPRLAATRVPRLPLLCSGPADAARLRRRACRSLFRRPPHSGVHVVL